jgi:ATP-dependent RNA helicase DDX49/DBP8
MEAEGGDIQLFSRRAKRPRQQAQELAVDTPGAKQAQKRASGAPAAQTAAPCTTPPSATAAAAELQHAQPSNPQPDEAAARSNGEASTSDATDFKGLGLSEWLCGVCQNLGITSPTEVQRGCIPAILQGRDVIGLAQTGSGKTAAFALPILQRLAKDPYGVFAVVLTPTRSVRGPNPLAKASGGCSKACSMSFAA